MASVSPVSFGARPGDMVWGEDAGATGIGPPGCTTMIFFWGGVTSHRGSSGKLMFSKLLLPSWKCRFQICHCVSQMISPGVKQLEPRGAGRTSTSQRKNMMAVHIHRHANSHLRLGSFLKSSRARPWNYPGNPERRQDPPSQLVLLLLLLLVLLLCRWVGGS